MEQTTEARRKTEHGKDFVYDARQVLAGMIGQGMAHPSTRPVLIWGGLGALAFGILPFVGMPLGFAVGAGYKFYKRVRPGR